MALSGTGMTSRGFFKPKMLYDSVLETFTVKVLLCCKVKQRKLFGTSVRRKMSFIDYRAGNSPHSWI